MIIEAGTTIFSEGGQELSIEKYLGSGGFGEVYKATDKEGGESYAVKTVRNPFDKNMLKSFRNEGKLAVTIEHKNVINYHYFHDGTEFTELPPYIVMEYANQGNLFDIINKCKADNVMLSNDELLSLFAQLVRGMAAINGKLIHRDIKPDNILINDEVIKITDFGLSKVIVESTRASTFKGYGCIPYMAPEGWRFDKNTIQMDIYSMGGNSGLKSSQNHRFKTSNPNS
ncbi:MAG: serine/threonine-protein kinase [Desulfobacula sp.]|nr:serine/threonine-protein kinase [Desulfobacula sp.]